MEHHDTTQIPLRRHDPGADVEQANLRCCLVGPFGSALRPADRLDEITSLPHAAQIVRAFFEPANSFAGSTFLTLGDNPAGRLTTDDLLAVSLLDVRFPPKAVRGLVVGADEEVNACLDAERIPADLVIWEATNDQLSTVSRFTHLLAVGYKGIGPVKADKIAARKRPSLVPIVDRAIQRVVGTVESRNDFRGFLRDYLQDPDRRTQIDDLHPSGEGTTIPTVRLLDALLWLLGSRSQAARAVMAGAGKRPSFILR